MDRPTIAKLGYNGRKMFIMKQFGVEISCQIIIFLIHLSYHSHIGHNHLLHASTMAI